ncbi:hypothetical protein ACN19N_07960 [Acinetobacter sp. LF10]|uniref:hypothetical protein n=1 Tax=Acinetobacter sp. LF10 TaxID=3403576 RepID=UPI003B214301
MTYLTKALIRQDIAGDLKEECNAHLDTLIALADAKAEYYAEKIKIDLMSAGIGGDKSFPVHCIQSFIYHSKAYKAEDEKSIRNVVKDSIKRFVHENKTEVVTTILSGYVKTLFGSSGQAEHKIQRNFVILEGVSIIRLDFVGWSRVVSQSLIKTKCEKIGTFVLYRSIVDMSKVSINDFISVYQETIRAENEDISYEEIIQKCQELYYAFNSPNRSRGLLMSKAVPAIDESESLETTKGYEDTEVFRKNLIIL